jgi:hypothetical protein
MTNASNKSTTKASGPWDPSTAEHEQPLADEVFSFPPVPVVADPPAPATLAPPAPVVLGFPPVPDVVGEPPVPVVLDEPPVPVVVAPPSLAAQLVVVVAEQSTTCTVYEIGVVVPPIVTR